MRKILFFTVILLSLAAGLLYGWVVLPRIHSATTIANLREDYRTDYTLMVAEVFSRGGNLEEAAQRMRKIDVGSPAAAAEAALDYAHTIGYLEQDLTVLGSLVTALQGLPPTPPGTGP